MKKGKHMKRNLVIKNESRFYSVLIILLSLVMIPIFKIFNQGDITGSILLLILGLMGYIGTYLKEDK